MAWTRWRRAARRAECEIVKRQSNTEKKEDIVFCKVTGEGNFIRMEYQFRLLYNFYDQGGWILDEVEPEKEDEWSLAYLDAEGNDVLDDMIWLDGFTPASLSGAKYYGTSSDTVYIGFYSRQNDSVVWNVYDQKGNQVLANTTIRSPEGSSFNPGSVYLSSDGKLRFSYTLSNNGVRTTYLIDENGTILNPDTSYNVWYQSNSGLLIVEQEIGDRPDNDYLYGAIDLDGNIVVPIQYENRSDADPDFVAPSLSADYQRIEMPDILRKKGFQASTLNGVFQQRIGDGYDFVDAVGQPIVDVPYDNLIIDIRNSMIIVIREDTFRLYDLNGNVRSPEFLLLDADGLTDPNFNINLYIVNYNGRCGILPTIATSEERSYFKYDWGSERFGSG